MSVLLEGDRLRLSSQVLVTGAAKHQMSVLSPGVLILQGQALGQVIALPSAMTLAAGWSYSIINHSSQPVTIRDFMGISVARLFSRQRLDLSLLDASTPQGKWSTCLLNVSQNPVDNCLFAIKFEGFNTTSKKWLNHHSSLASDALPAVVPFSLCHLVAFTFSNSQDEASAIAKVYKNGTTDLNALQVFKIDSVKKKSFTLDQELPFRINDDVSVSIEAVSGKGFVPTNPIVTLYFKVIEP